MTSTAARVWTSSWRLALRSCSSDKATTDSKAIPGSNRSSLVNCKSSILQPVFFALYYYPLVSLLGAKIFHAAARSLAMSAARAERSAEIVLLPCAVRR